MCYLKWKVSAAEMFLGIRKWGSEAISSDTFNNYLKKKKKRVKKNYKAHFSL